MISAGVDVGIENIKAVVLKDGKVLARGMASSGGANRAGSVEQIWKEVLKSAKLSSADVGKVVATGQGKCDVQFANDSVVEPVADANAALWLFPAARSVIDIGADQARAVIFDAKGHILDTLLNQKCTAGIGTSLESIARTLGMTLEEMSRLAGNTKDGISVNDRCAVFAELDAIGLLHGNTPRESIVQAINEAMAARINSMLNERTALQKEVALVGGVARNTGMVNALKKRVGISFLIPEQPEFAGALGAALIAAG